MTDLRLIAADSALAEPGIDAVVIGVRPVAGAADTAGGVTVEPVGAQSVDDALGGRLVEGLRAAGASGAAGSTTRLPTLGALGAPVVLAVGLGDAGPEGAASTETLRRAAGAASRALGGAGRPTVLSLLALAGGGSPDSVAAVAEGHLLGAYSYAGFHGAAPAPTGVGAVVIALPAGHDGGGGEDALQRAGVVAEAVSLVRDLVNTPAGALPPVVLAGIAEQRAGEVGLQVDVLDESALADGGYGGILGVGQGSANPPRLVRVRYDGGGRRVALVGKGITFDSGGLSIKPAAAMEDMKTDMAGAATVLATTLAAARLRLPVTIDCWMPLAENMVSGTSIRPGDVLTTYNGTTVEVLNTDAEGRIVLADALARALEETPERIVDVATLTGAQIVALGTRVAAVMGNDDEFRADVVAAAAAAGESMWPMPLPEELRASLDSPVADLQNIGDKFGGMLVAGLFLREFVPAGTPWTHLDIAGPSYHSGEPYGYVTKGGTGMAVRTLLRLLEDLAATPAV